MQKPGHISRSPARLLFMVSKHLSTSLLCNQETIQTGPTVQKKRRMKLPGAAVQLKFLHEVMAEKTWLDLSYRSATGPWARAATKLNMKNNSANRKMLALLWQQTVSTATSRIHYVSF